MNKHEWPDFDKRFVKVNNSETGVPALVPLGRARQVFEYKEVCFSSSVLTIHPCGTVNWSWILDKGGDFAKWVLCDGPSLRLHSPRLNNAAAATTQSGHCGQ